MGGTEAGRARGQVKPRGRSVGGGGGIVKVAVRAEAGLGRGDQSGRGDTPPPLLQPTKA